MVTLLLFGGGFCLGLGTGRWLWGGHFTGYEGYSEE